MIVHVTLSNSDDELNVKLISHMISTHVILSNNDDKRMTHVILSNNDDKQMTYVILSNSEIEHDRDST